MIDWMAYIGGGLLWIGGLLIGFALGCWVGNKKGWFRGYMQGFLVADYGEYHDPNHGV